MSAWKDFPYNFLSSFLYRLVVFKAYNRDLISMDLVKNFAKSKFASLTLIFFSVLRAKVSFLLLI